MQPRSARRGDVAGDIPVSVTTTQYTVERPNPDRSTGSLTCVHVSRSLRFLPSPRSRPLPRPRLRTLPPRPPPCPRPCLRALPPRPRPRPRALPLAPTRPRRALVLVPLPKRIRIDRGPDIPSRYVSATHRVQRVDPSVVDLPAS
jgi:hypothetical protein